MPEPLKRIVEISARAFQRLFGCKTRLRYSRDRALSSLPALRVLLQPHWKPKHFRAARFPCETKSGLFFFVILTLWVREKMFPCCIGNVLPQSVGQIDSTSNFGEYSRTRLERFIMHYYSHYFDLFGNSFREAWRPVFQIGH